MANPNEIHPDDLALLQESGIKVDTPAAEDTAGKTTPVPETKTDAPVQVNQEASTSASSGDSLDTQETKILDNGNQVVDGIEYTKDGIEIGAYTEGETQEIKEGPKTEAERIRAKADEEHGITEKEKLDDNLFYENINKQQSEAADEFINNNESFKGLQEDFALVSRPKIEQYAQKLQTQNPNITEEEFHKKLTAYQQQLWGDFAAGSSVLEEVIKEANVYAKSVTQAQLDEFNANKRDKYRKEGLEEASGYRKFLINTLGYNPDTFEQETIGGDIGQFLFQLSVSGDKMIGETFDSVQELGEIDKVGVYTNIQSSYDNLLKQGDLSQAKYDELTAKNDEKIELVKASHYAQLARKYE